MQLRFVGCGDAFGSGGRFNTCFHVTGTSVNFLIDCGASSLPALKRHGISREDIDLILIKSNGSRFDSGKIENLFDQREQGFS